MEKKTIFQNKLIHWFLEWLVYRLIDLKINLNRNNFKPGDLLKYNWKAKVILWSIIKKGLKPRVMLEYLYPDNLRVEFEDGDTCSSFWLRKLYFWEKWYYEKTIS